MNGAVRPAVVWLVRLVRRRCRLFARVGWLALPLVLLWPATARANGLARGVAVMGYIALWTGLGLVVNLVLGLVGALILERRTPLAGPPPEGDEPSSERKGERVEPAAPQGPARRQPAWDLLLSALAVQALSNAAYTWFYVNVLCIGQAREEFSAPAFSVVMPAIGTASMFGAYVLGYVAWRSLAREGRRRLAVVAFPLLAVCHLLVACLIYSGIVGARALADGVRYYLSFLPFARPPDLM